MMRKISCVADIFTVVFAVLSLLSLGLPLFSTKLTGGIEAGTITIKGIELFSFSPWGYVVGFVPFALLMLMYVYDKVSHKYPLVFLLVFLGLFAHNACVLAAREWIYGIADGFVRSMGNMLFYPAFLVSAGFMLMLDMNDLDSLWYLEDYDNKMEMDSLTEEVNQEETAA